VQRAEGVHHVIVGGKVVLDHGRHTGALPGRVLRAGRPS
jgi:N-acyl-D-aspartate/D-glutamate deacylase